MIFFIAIHSACTTDYNPGDLKYREPDCIGVNSLLNPLNPIQINLFQIRRNNNKYASSGLEGAHVTFKEDNSILYEGIVTDSILILPQKPQAGKNYYIEVSYRGLPTVKAFATVPAVIKCNVSMELVEYKWGRSEGYLVKVKDVEMNKQSKATLWITAYETRTDEDNFEFGELYCNSALADKDNMQADGNGALNKWVGSVYYEFFLRIKNKNVFMLDELIFSPFSYMNRESQSLVIQLTTANPEYDQYCKTLYKQELIKSYDDALSMMFYQPQEIYCNIENGLGIFAGINEQKYYFDAK